MKKLVVNLWVKIRAGFMKTWQYARKHKLISFAVLAGLVIVALLIGRGMRQRADAVGSYQTALVERGTLTATVGATGTARANQSAVLVWQASGRVEQVYAAVGDAVEGDQLLANLLSTSLSQSLILAQADLVSARRNLDTLMESDLQRAQAQLNLVNAQKAYDSADATLSMLLGVNRGGTSEDILNARSQVTIAQNNLNQAESLYNSLSDRPDDDVQKAQAYTNLYNARIALTRAKNSLNFFLLVPSGRDIELARAKLALGEAQLEDAQREWDRLKDGPDPDDILAAQARVDAALASVQMAEIHAPFAGTITSAEPIPGDLVSPGASAFRVDDLSRLLVDVQLTEVDINRVQPGQPVLVTFDAALGQEYHGEVVEVAQVGVPVQGAVYFDVTIELTDADERVRPGMTAAVTITVQQLEDVLLVPNRAVRLVNGQRVVYVLRGNQLEQVDITLGSTSDLVSEVVDGGLQVGDQIVLNPPTSFFQQGEGPGFMGP